MSETTGAPPTPPPHKELEANAQYIGLNAARAIAISVGWSRAQTIILIQVPLVATIATLAFATETPYKNIILMFMGCITGFLLNMVLLAVVSRSNKYVDLYNQTLQKIEVIGFGAPAPFYNSGEYNRVARGWGIRTTLQLIAAAGLFFWAGLLCYIVVRHYPGISREILERTLEVVRRILWR